MYGLYSRAASNEERPMMARVRYTYFLLAIATTRPCVLVITVSLKNKNVKYTNGSTTTQTKWQKKQQWSYQNLEWPGHKSDFPSYNKNKNICFSLRTIVLRLSSPKKFIALNTTSALILTMCIQKTSLTSFLWRFSLLIQQLLVWWAKWE